MGLSVGPGEAEGASQCDQVGGGWRELGLHFCPCLLPDSPRQCQSSDFIWPVHL